MAFLDYSGLSHFLDKLKTIFVLNTSKGQANGVASLDSTGKVPAAQIPTSARDVVEGYYYNNKFYEEDAHTTEITGETGKLYVSKDTDKIYRFENNSYLESKTDATVVSQNAISGQTNVNGALSALDSGLVSITSSAVKSVNTITPDANTGNVTITNVPYADNLIADDAQSSSGTFVTRTTGGDASLSDGDAWLNTIKGNCVHTGYSSRDVNMVVNAAATVPRQGTITTSVDRSTLVSVLNDSSEIPFSYTNAWNIDPTVYGITVTGTPVYGDEMTLNYIKEDIDMEVITVTRPTPAGLSTSLNKATFIAYVNNEPGSYTITYTTSWSTSPSSYGLTITGTPLSGDSVTINYDGEDDPSVEVYSPRTPDDPITATLNRSTFVSYVLSSGIITLTYTSTWSADPTSYGITVTGTPISGDVISINYTKEVISNTVNAVTTVIRENPITATIDEETFDAVAEADAVYTFTYTTQWDMTATNDVSSASNVTLADYGITLTNSPVANDEIVVTCVKEIRGTISVFDPDEFYSTNWNLYSNTLGYARTLKYSDSYGFIVGGTFTSLSFSETNDPSATKTPITPVDMGGGKYWFEVESDGFTWVTGGNATDTYIMMTWSDWQNGHPGDFAAHYSSTIDLSSVTQTYFPYGLMRVDTYADEINISLQTAYSRVQRMSYSLANLATARATGRPFDYDENYIYLAKETADSYSITLDGLYTANDHGLEVFTGTTVPGYAEMIYGQNLKDKLRTDVVTISAQTLTSNQKKQIRTNIDATSSSELSAVQDGLAIVSNGNTHAAIAAGKFVYVRNHGTLNEGLYRANSAIAANATLSSSNLTSVGSEGLSNDMLTISQQTLTNAQKLQVQDNTGTSATITFLNSDTVDVVYNKLRSLKDLATATIYINGTAMSNLTNNAYSAGASGTVAKISSSNYRFNLIFGSGLSMKINQTNMSSSSWGTSDISFDTRYLKFVSTDTTETFYAKLNTLSTGETAAVYLDATAMSNITNAKIATSSYGTVGKYSSTDFRFLLNANSNKVVSMKISSLTTSSWGTPSITQYVPGNQIMLTGESSYTFDMGNNSRHFIVITGATNARCWVGVVVCSDSGIVTYGEIYKASNSIISSIDVSAANKFKVNLTGTYSLRVIDLEA